MLKAKIKESNIFIVDFHADVNTEISNGELLLSDNDFPPVDIHEDEIAELYYAKGKMYYTIKKKHK